MIAQKEYQARRQALAKCLPSDGLALIPAAHETFRNGDVHHRFRQDSDFYYLTGFNEPDALLVIIGGTPTQSILFNRARCSVAEQWSGVRLGQEDACAVLGVDAAYALTALDTQLPELMAGKRTIYYALDRHPSWVKRFQTAWEVVKGQTRRGVMAPEAFYDLTPVIGELRLFKSPAEIRLLERAIDISVTAHQRAMRACQEGVYEYQMEAELLYEFSRQGCRSAAYDSIVATGNNACVLHYTANDQRIKSGDLVLIDAGGEFENYAADITRTFPANGRFSNEQRLIYECVSRAQKAGIACVRPGTPWDAVQRTMVNILTTGLVELGILKGRVEELIEKEAYKPMYMHQSGHWLGLDVHDSGRYKIDGKWRLFEPGMVLTVEPGLYIKRGMEGVDSRWWGIGVRIEDDIHVTKDGNKNLSERLPVTIHDIEAVIRG